MIFCLLFELINLSLLNFSTIPRREEQRVPHGFITYLAWISRQVLTSYYSCIVLYLDCLINFFANLPMLGEKCAFVTSLLAVVACLTV